MPVLSCNCGQKVRVPEGRPGARFRCPKCGQAVSAPAEAAAPVLVLAPPEAQSEEGPFETERTRGRGKAPNSMLAITSLILGLAALICAPIGPILGLIGTILGVIALISIGNSNGRVRGTGLAFGGIAACIVFATLTSFGYYLAWKYVIKGAVDKVTQAAGRAEGMNDLKELGIAMHRYHEAHNTFPPAAIYSKDGRPLLSWRVAILPFLGAREEQLYRRFHLDEPWDSPHNTALLAEMPEVFRTSSDDAAGHTTRYQAFVGPGTVFDGKRGLSIASIQDGSSNTLLVVEAADPVPWTKPEDIAYAPNRPLPRFHSRGGGGFLVLMADGGVRTFRGDFDEAEMRKAITRNDGMVIDFIKLEK